MREARDGPGVGWRARAGAGILVGVLCSVAGGHGSTPNVPAPKPGPNTGIPPVTPAKTPVPRPITYPRWQQHWDVTRERHGAFRQLLPLAGEGRDRRRPDPLQDRRARVLDALEAVAREPGNDEALRRAALVALGRMGPATATKTLLSLLDDTSEADGVREAAGLALGLAPDDAALRDAVRAPLARWVRAPPGPECVTRAATMAAGLRAAGDAGLVFLLCEVTAGPLPEGQEVTSLLAACGLSRARLVLPELMRAARDETLGGRKLTDLGLAHALFALGRLDEPAAASILLERLRGDGTDAPRAAALALGRQLRDGVFDAEAAARVRTALREVLAAPEKPYLRGLAALGLATSPSPEVVADLRRALRSDPLLRPYAALALGMVSRRLDAGDAAKVHTVLAELLKSQRRRERAAWEAYRKATKRPHPDARPDEVPNSWARAPRDYSRGAAIVVTDEELGSAAALALGLGRAVAHVSLLEERLKDKNLGWRARGVTAVALGLVGETTDDGRRTLVRVLRTGSHEVLFDVALALGMLGDTDAERILLDVLALEALPRDNSLARDGADPARRLRAAKEAALLALGRYGRPAAVAPLLAFLEDEARHAELRRAAAVGLGLLGDQRSRDVFAYLYEGTEYGTAIPLDALLDLSGAWSPSTPRQPPPHTRRPGAPSRPKPTRPSDR